ncbi:hypothetical protein [Streptomyces chrestomyceticus]|uniref:hypothetical protein n=1 Tax=Streptomyces chrestomyceticus TaxID=68185 RepID=UPI003405CFA9
MNTDPITTRAATDAFPRPPHTLSPIHPLPARDHGPQPGVVVPPEQLAMLIAAAQLAQQPAAPAPPPDAPTRVSGRAKGAALIACAGGCGVGMATAGIGYGAGVVADHSEELMTVATAAAIGAGSLTVLLLVLRALVGGRAASRTDTAPPVVHQVHQSVTNRGFIASGSINN